MPDPAFSGEDTHGQPDLPRGELAFPIIPGVNALSDFIDCSGLADLGNPMNSREQFKPVGRFEATDQIGHLVEALACRLVVGKKLACFILGARHEFQSFSGMSPPSA